MKNVNNKTNYFTYAKAPIKELFEKYQTSPKGIFSEQADSLRKEYGDNRVRTENERSVWKELLKAFVNPFTIVLIGLGLLSLVTDVLLATPEEREIFGVVMIYSLVFVSGMMSFIQTSRSTKVAEKLSAMITVTATVKRSNTIQEIEMDHLVCGDVVVLSAGDLVPADIRLLSTKDLFISQAALTGESYPVEKNAHHTVNDTDNETDLENLIFMGSNVISGSAEGIVIATGNRTLFGDVAASVTGAAVETSFDRGINKTSKLFIWFMAIMAPTVILLNGFTSGDWMAALLFGLSVAVGLTPEMLPMIVTTNLVKGAHAMAKKGTVIKNINAIQNFGAIDVLCTDKTGTLTNDKIVMEYHYNCRGEEDERVLRHAYLNSSHQTGLKNLLDVAIIEAYEAAKTTDDRTFTKVDEIPFDFNRRRMSVVVSDEEGKTQLITKGAIEEMLRISSFVDFGGMVEPLTEEVKAYVLGKVQELNKDGMRVIGVAQKTNPYTVDEFSVADEMEMVLIGYLAFLDSPKDSTKEALETLEEHGVHVKVITGDNELVTRSVCRQVGLDTSKLISGSELSRLDQEAYEAAVRDYTIFVKITPSQKEMITKTLQSQGKTVGFLGDGINDAPAMKAADVGISVDSAVDIAKESADVILLQKDLMVLERGIRTGRNTFGNIMKYIKATASSNFGNMFSVLIASAFLPFLPMLPMQLLFLNLLYDFSCMSLPWDRMDEEYLDEPKNWDASSIGRFMFWFGPTSSIFDVTTFLLMYFLIGPAVAGGSFTTLSGADQALFIAVFHTGWFLVSLFTQVFVLYALRSPYLPFIESRPSVSMLAITIGFVIFGSLVPYTALGTTLGLVALPLSFFGWLFATLLAYMILVTIVKSVYIKKYKEFL